MTPTLNVIYSFISIATLTKIVYAYTENEPLSISARNLITKTCIKQITAQNECLWKYGLCNVSVNPAGSVKADSQLNMTRLFSRAVNSS